MVSYIGDRFITTWATREALFKLSVSQSVQLLSHVRLFATPWTAAHQASLSITNFRSLPKLMSIEPVMLSNHLILCRPLLLLPSILLTIRVFSNESALHPAYLTYIQNTSWEMLGWKKHKLESRLLGEISITSDIQMISPYGRKWKGTKKPLDESERRE